MDNIPLKTTPDSINPLPSKEKPSDETTGSTSGKDPSKLTGDSTVNTTPWPITPRPPKPPKEEPGTSEGYIEGASNSVRNGTLAMGESTNGTITTGTSGQGQKHDEEDGVATAGVSQEGEVAMSFNSTANKDEAVPEDGHYDYMPRPKPKPKPKPNG